MLCFLAGRDCTVLCRFRVHGIFRLFCREPFLAREDSRKAVIRPRMTSYDLLDAAAKPPRP